MEEIEKIINYSEISIKVRKVGQKYTHRYVHKPTWATDMDFSFHFINSYVDIHVLYYMYL